MDNSVAQIGRAIDTYNIDTLDRLRCSSDFPRLVISPTDPRHAYIEIVGEATYFGSPTRYPAGTGVLGLFDFNESNGKTRIDAYVSVATYAITNDITRLGRVIENPTRCPDD